MKISTNKEKIKIRRDLQKYWVNKMKMGWGKSSGARKGFYFFSEAANFVKGGVILDAGAGQLRFKPFFDKSVYLSQEHTDGIKFKGMEKIEYDLISPLDKKIPLQDNCLDEIINNSTLEHIKYPERFFAEAFRVLKPGGRIYLSVPFICLEHEIPYDFQRPTRFGLERWLKDAGFIEIKIKAGSTCIQGVISYLPVAIVYDLLQTDKNPKKVFWEIFHSKNGYFKIIKKIPKFLLAGIGYFSMKLFVSLVSSLTNVSVYPEANMPSGWLGVASKPGKYLKKRYKNKEEFMNKNKINL